jgi:hypothetical protein
MNLNRGKVYFGSHVWRFQSMVGWSCCFWAYGEAAHHDMVTQKQKERKEETSMP